MTAVSQCHDGSQPAMAVRSTRHNHSQVRPENMIREVSPPTMTTQPAILRLIRQHKCNVQCNRFPERACEGEGDGEDEDEGQSESEGEGDGEGEGEGEGEGDQLLGPILEKSAVRSLGPTLTLTLTLIFTLSLSLSLSLTLALTLILTSPSPSPLTHPTD
jgi:hypothetical protein